MVMVRPFRGLRYNHDMIDSFESVLAPPYDVISEPQQNQLYECSPYNVVRIILAREKGDERYRSAAHTFQKWISERVLVQDDETGIYPYYLEFEDEGKRAVRRGFIAAIKIEDFSEGKVLPHELTFAKHKEDRLKLTKATDANLSPVFAVYSDPDGGIEEQIHDKVSNTPPIINALSGEGVRSKLWKITEPGLLESISNALVGSTVLIADGHHRYETALNYMKFRKKSSGDSSGESEYEYVMMYLSRAESDGLIIKPTHRVISNAGPLTFENILNQVMGKFDVKRVSLKIAAASLGKEEFLMVTGQHNTEHDYVYKLSPKELHKESFRNLAVMQLHTSVLGSIISEKYGGIEYTKSMDEAVELVRTRGYELAFILPPLSALDIFDVTFAGEKMPHKSTYFYPKIPSGLVFHLLG